MMSADKSNSIGKSSSKINENSPKSNAKISVTASSGRSTVHSEISAKDLNAVEEKSKAKYEYGWRGFHPKWLQCFHKPRWLLAFLCFAVIIQGFITNGILRAAATQLERRFHILSDDIGLIDSMNDIGGLLMLIPIARYGGDVHKGRWIGIGIFVMALGSLTCAIPHFVGEYEYGKNITDFSCKNTDFETSQIADHGRSSLRNWKFMFMLGQLLHGIGASPFYTMSITYLDENISQQKSSIYIGLYHGCGIVGPLLGYLFFFFVMKLYGDFDKIGFGKPPKNLTQDDPRWYGAWWLGPIVSGCLAIFITPLILGFGRQLPGAEKARKKDVDQAYQITDSDEIELPAAFANCTGILNRLWNLAKNPTYLLLIAAQICSAFVTAGFASFLAKYLETMFSLKSGIAALYVAAAAMPAAFIGTIAGAVIQRLCHLKCKGTMTLSAIAISGCLLSSFAFFITCPTASFAGSTVSYPVDGNITLSGGGNLTHVCNSECGCLKSQYDPVCADDGKTRIFSPCFAGCKEKSDSMAWDCGCLPTNGTVKLKNVCKSQCAGYKFVLFMVGLAMVILFAFSTISPIQQATLRCVPFDQRTFAVAISLIPIRLLGPIPGAPAIGALIRTACILWQGDDGEEEVCVLYDNEHLALCVRVVVMVGFSLCLIALLAALKLYRPPPAVPAPTRNDPSSSDASADSATTKNAAVAADQAASIRDPAVGAA